jgi:hypothetical protein
MADPVLDEQWIIQLLNCSPSTENLARIQQGAVQALMDVYDRKVTRSEFADAASPCLALFGQCSKLWVLGNIEDAFNKGGVNQASFDHAREGIQAVLGKQIEHVVGIVKRLQECPTSEDKVH